MHYEPLIEQNNMNREKRKGSGSSPRATSPESRACLFTFVTEHTESQIRSHVMRHHWKRRRQSKNDENLHIIRPLLLPKPILVAGGINNADSNDGSDCQCRWALGQQTCPGDDLKKTYDPSCILSSGLNPFYNTPIPLTRQHRMLLHHWIVSHGQMISVEQSASGFSTVRDIWFPLDLSNAASFNLLLAHSASQMAYAHTKPSPWRMKYCVDALTYKTEAIRLLNLWMSDSQKAISDNAFAAVLRLLTFEEYFGTEEEWYRHRRGIQKMMEVRGGFNKPNDDWRLYHLIYLHSIMTEPSWFNTNNNIFGLRSETGSPDLPIDLQKIRSLWLVSFIYDLKLFVQLPFWLGATRSPRYPSLYGAIFPLGDRSLPEDYDGSHNTPSSFDYGKLSSLLSIGVIVHDSHSLSAFTSTSMPIELAMATFDATLEEYRGDWVNSIQALRSALDDHFIKHYPDGAQKRDFASQLARTVQDLGAEATRLVQNTLLCMLLRAEEY